MTEKHTEHETAHPGEIELNELSMAIIAAVFSAGSFWAYANGYVVALKNLSLGKYSFLVVGIFFALGAMVSAWNHFTSQQKEKNK